MQDLWFEGFCPAIVVFTHPPESQMFWRCSGAVAYVHTNVHNIQFFWLLETIFHPALSWNLISWGDDVRECMCLCVLERVALCWPVCCLPLAPHCCGHVSITIYITFGFLCAQVRHLPAAQILPMWKSCVNSYCGKRPEHILLNISSKHMWKLLICGGNSLCGDSDLFLNLF